MCCRLHNCRCSAGGLAKCSSNVTPPASHSAVCCLCCRPKPKKKEEEEVRHV